MVVVVVEEEEEEEEVKEEENNSFESHLCKAQGNFPKEERKLHPCAFVSSSSAQAENNRRTHSHLVAPDFYCREWGVSIRWRAAEFIYKGCGQVCWENSHSFRSVRPNDIG
ncbi:unnamed protein product [Pleuronectes platessa]|uniref:Uncharacterized protein n=1 Tax=Pleuronectes platessa TaxID=8262 RepID=A0A9N7U4B9_PLEPL|nr:unnamed protein product [Pleuronectes platessa]